VADLLTGVYDVCPTLDADAVREIVSTDLTDAQLNAFINIAYNVTRLVSGDLGSCGGGGMECDIMKLVAAHFVTLREGSAKSESIGGEYSVTYRGQDGLGLSASLYGQNALAIDCSGKLAKLGLRKAQLRSVGYYDFLGTTFMPPDRSDDED
jgi:hypothetical protein